MIKISKKQFSFLFLLFLGILIINDAYSFDSTEDAINLPYLFNEFFAGITGYAVTSASLFENLSGPVAYWNLDEGTGTIAYDSSGNGNIGNISGAIWVPGKIGNALQFDGVDDSVDAGNDARLDTTSAMTVEAWVYQDCAGYDCPFGTIASKMDPYNEGWNLFISENEYWFEIYSGGVWKITGHNTRGYGNGGEYSHHLAGVFNGTHITLYVDGIPSDWALVSQTPSAAITNHLYIGNAERRGPYKGIIDEVKVYDRALSSAEILAEYQAGITDLVSPAAITDLSVIDAASDSVMLTWTAPGDDGTAGIASAYDIRYSTAQINDANWDSAVRVTGVHAPMLAGNMQSFTATGLNAGTTYYFAIKTADEVPNWSSISNSPNATTITNTNTTPFRFIVWSDTESGNSVLSGASIAVNELNPAFTLYPGDLVKCTSSASCWSAGFPAFKTALDGNGTNSIFNKTFATRGNHENAADVPWRSAFNFTAVASTVGATNYTAQSEDMTYSFDYANSHFVGIDMVGGGSNTMTSAQISWLDADLTAAEGRGMKQAFLFWHGPVYPVGKHCCSGASSALIAVFNKHAIIDAGFFGHEMVLTYTHMNSSRLSGLLPANEFEEFVDGNVGDGNNSGTIQRGRVDYGSTAAYGFIAVDVLCDNFNVSIYRLNGTFASVDKSYSFSTDGGCNRSVSATFTSFTNFDNSTNSTSSINSTNLTNITNITSCTNGILDGDETGIDCGGSCPACGADVTSPSISITCPSGSPTYNVTQITVVGTAADAESGINKVEFSVDFGLTWIQATGTTSWNANTILSSSNNGVNTIIFRAVDNAGNPSAISSVTATYNPAAATKPALGNFQKSNSDPATQNNPNITYDTFTDGRIATLNRSRPVQNALEMYNLAGFSWSPTYISGRFQSARNNANKTDYLVFLMQEEIIQPSASSWYAGWMDAQASHPGYPGDGGVHVVDSVTGATVDWGAPSETFYLQMLTAWKQLCVNLNKKCAILNDGQSDPAAFLPWALGASGVDYIAQNYDMIYAYTYPSTTAQASCQASGFYCGKTKVDYWRSKGFTGKINYILTTNQFGAQSDAVVEADFKSAADAGADIISAYPYKYSGDTLATARMLDIWNRYGGAIVPSSPICTVPLPSLCNNGIQDAGETGIDCGGSCPECPDIVAPFAITDLAILNKTSNSMMLTWTAPGDDGNSGTASQYDIRYSVSPIDASNWALATAVAGEPVPSALGTSQSMTITGLAAAKTYYFAMMAADEVPNWSGLSNIASATTDPLPPVAKKPAAYWKFDEGTGTTAYDSSGSGYTATLKNSPKWVPGKSGSAIKFDGINDYVDARNVLNLGTGNWTISFWISQQPATGSRTAVAKGSSGGTGDILIYDLNDAAKGRMMFRNDQNTGAKIINISASSLAGTGFRFVAVTRAGRTVSTYLDGVLYKTGTIQSSYKFSNSHRWTFGAREDGKQTFLNGTLDEIKIYKQALSADEIMAEYSQ